MVALEWPHCWDGIFDVAVSLIRCFCVTYSKAEFRSRYVRTFTSNYKIGRFAVVVSSITFGSMLIVLHFYRQTNDIPVLVSW